MVSGALSWRLLDTFVDSKAQGTYPQVRSSNFQSLKMWGRTWVRNELSPRMIQLTLY